MTPTRGFRILAALLGGLFSLYALLAQEPAPISSPNDDAKAKSKGDPLIVKPARTEVIEARIKAVLRRLSDRALTRWWVGSIDFEEIKSPLVSFGSLILRAYWALARVLIRW